MFVFQLMGGLGNQMFAYAAARSLAVRRGIPVKFDFDCPYRHIKYEYALDIFNLTAEFATSKELRKVKPKRGIERRLYRLLGKNTAPRLIKEWREFVFCPELYSIADDAYISGFWQTEEYFLPIETEIREDFQFRNPPDSINASILQRIDDSNSVGIHIRRGDYVNISSTNAAHGLSSIDYYRQAISMMERSVPNAVYFFFSNDIEWVKENRMTDQESVFVENNTGSSSYEDLRLMSRCKHNIIANSSFSWWGAWLNSNPDKIVIAPKQWMVDPSINTKDLIPAAWIRI